MARADYDRNRFDELGGYQPPFEDPYASVDDAGPTGVGRQLPVVRWATRCEFDEGDDLVYGDEVPFVEWTESVTLPLPDSGVRIMKALVFETQDKGLTGQTITYTAFPDSKNDRGFARLKGVSHHTQQENIWNEIEHEIRQGKPIDRILDCFTHDLWRTSEKEPSDKTLRAYIFEPLQEGAKAFSGARASKPQFQQAKKFARDGIADSRFLDDLAPELAAICNPRNIFLYGIVKDYDAALTWLLTRKSTRKLLERAENGTLFDEIITIPRKVVPQAARNQALETLHASAHNVLCGTFDPDDYRGFVQGIRNPNALHKQTLATHLKDRFIYAMSNFCRRCLNRNLPQEIGFEDLGQQAAKSPESDPISFDEQIARLKSTLPGHRPKRKALGALADALRSDDEVNLVAALALTVALHELGLTDKNAVTVIHELNGMSGQLDEDVRQAIQEAVDRMQSP